MFQWFQSFTGSPRYAPSATPETEFPSKPEAVTRDSGLPVLDFHPGFRVGFAAAVSRDSSNLWENVSGTFLPFLRYRPTSFSARNTALRV
jgi:hypothetical protein